MSTGTRYFENLVDESQTALEGQFMALAQRYMKTNCATPGAWTTSSAWQGSIRRAAS